MEKMTPHEYEVAKHIATRALKFRVDYDNKGNLYFEILGHKYTFEHKTDAQIMEELSKTWNQINVCLFEVINEKLLAFVAQNKTNFN